MHRNEFAAALQVAIDHCLVSGRDHPNVRAFLDNVVTRLLVRADDLLGICSALNDERASIEFLRFVVQHPLVDRELLHTIVTSPEIFHALPDDMRWKEAVVLLYGSLTRVHSRRWLCQATRRYGELTRERCPRLTGYDALAHARQIEVLPLHGCGAIRPGDHDAGQG
jgi:hypothetical protein